VAVAHRVDMRADDRLGLTDRQARAVIIAAERLGFEREPDLYECCHCQSRWGWAVASDGCGWFSGWRRADS